MSETTISTDTQIAETDDLDAFSAGFFGQKPAETASTKVEAEQENSEESKVEETEVEQTAETEEEDLNAEYVEPKPKKQTVQDRINELVKQREEAKREAAAEVERLRKEFEEYKRQAEQVKQPTNTNTVAEPKPDDLKSDGTPKYELGEFDPNYIRDLTRHTLEVERTQVMAKFEQERVAQQQMQAQQALQAEWNGKMEAATTVYPDFVEKGQALLSNFNNLEPNYANYLGNVLMNMEKGPDVLYYLSNHPDEARAIVNSGAQKATVALGRIEARFIESEKQAPKPKITKAPPPPPVRARGTNGAFISVAPDTDDLDAFTAEFFRRK